MVASDTPQTHVAHDLCSRAVRMLRSFNRCSPWLFVLVLSETVLTEAVLSETVLVLDGCLNCGDFDAPLRSRFEKPSTAAKVMNRWISIVPVG